MSTTPPIATLSKKAQACLAKKVDMPMSPLWNMARAAKYNKQTDLNYLQEALNYLTCKARNTMTFEADEKEFLKEVYEAFYWGGQYKGYKEAASLANHYVNGEGKLLKIDAEMYKQSKIVIATMSAMKKHVLDLVKAKNNFAMFKCSNPVFMATPYAAPLKRMNFRTEGKMKAGGVLEAAQNDHRLHKADGHFFLMAQTVRGKNNSYKTIWSVDSVYDFESFKNKNYYTEIPLGSNKLIIYDGLSEYMTQIGVAKVFNYRADWTEHWA